MFKKITNYFNTLNKIDKSLEEVKTQLKPKESKDYDFVRDGLNSNENSLWASEIQNFLDQRTLKGLFYSEDWVFICCDLLASQMNPIPLKIYSKTLVNGQESYKENPTHPLNSVFNNPNKFQSGSSFKYNMGIEDCLMGNIIIWFQKQTQQLFIIPSENVTIKFNDDLSISHYEYINADIFADIPLDAKRNKIPVEEIIHIKRPHPNNLLMGLSPFLAGRQSLLFNKYTSDYLNNFYLKGATPSFAITIEGGLGQDERNRILKDFEMKYTGRRNQRRAIMLSRGMDLKPITTPLVDQGLPELVKMNQDKILNILRIPKHALSLAESGSLGSEEYKQALKFMFTGAVMPMLNRIETALTQYFKDYLIDSKIEFDLSEVSLLKDDELKKSDLSIKLLSTHTINEVRNLLYDLPPVPEGNVIQNTQPTFTPFQNTLEKPMVLLSESISVPIQNDIQENPKKKSDIYKEKYVTFFEKSSQKEKITEKDYLSLKKLSLNTLEKTYSESIKVLKTFNKSLKTKALEDDIKEKIGSKIKVLQKVYVKDYTQILSSSVDTGFGIGLSSIFDERAVDAITAASSKNGNRYTLLEARGIDTFQNTSKTTTNDIMKIVANGLENQNTIDEVIKEIEKVYPNDIQNRSETIARTETLTAVSIGQAGMLEVAKEIIPDLKKVWITSNDDRVRESHQSVDGEIKNPDESFSNGLDYPRDTNGDPSETINCRCDFLFLPPEDLSEISSQL